MANLMFMTCFIVFSLCTALIMLIMGYIFSYKSPDKIKSSTYECGLNVKTFSKIKFNIRYFNYLIMFMIFDTVSIFIYPLPACNIEYSNSHYGIILIYISTVLIALIKFVREVRV